MSIKINLTLLSEITGLDPEELAEMMKDMTEEELDTIREMIIEHRQYEAKVRLIMGSLYK
jgi:nucleoid-associated protein YejK